MFTLNCKGRILTIDQPIVMGILNINNDSFYTGSRFTNEEQLLIMAEKNADGRSYYPRYWRSKHPTWK